MVRAVNGREQRRIDRERRLSRATQRKLGIKAPRNRGSTPLRKDKKRFEIALWLLFTTAGGMNHYEAAYLVMLLAGPLDISSMTSIEDILFVLSGDRPQYGTDIEHYAEGIIRRSVEVVRRAEEFEMASGKRSPELGWLASSMACLTMLFARECEATAVALACVELAHLGWRQRVLEMRLRWESAMQSNFPPHAEKLKRLAAALLARTKSAKPLK
jgi:hypothetical protein